jgi:hypothetical protein
MCWSVPELPHKAGLGKINFSFSTQSIASTSSSSSP